MTVGCVVAKNCVRVFFCCNDGLSPREPDEC